MDLSARQVLPEILDGIDPSDPRAMRSRRDLRRVHRALRTVSILRNAVSGCGLRRRRARCSSWARGMPRGCCGSRDSCRNGRRCRSRARRAGRISAETRTAYRALGWELQVVRQDVMQWAAEPGTRHYDLCLTNLFLHHFERPALDSVMRAIASSADALIACEPRRNALVAWGSKAIGLLGTNDITREERTPVWSRVSPIVNSLKPAMRYRSWSCEEYAAFPFMHCFTAVKNSVRATEAN